MAVQKKGGSLNGPEKKIVKRLLQKKWRNQDIQAIVNFGRKVTINSARITGVKNDVTQGMASDGDVERFLRIKRSYNPKTGLNQYEHERLIRAREAMILAVQVFNSPAHSFKSELFCVLSNIAWTYLFHEYYHRNDVEIVKENGYSIALSEMIAREDCPISEGVRLNLQDVKRLRDKVEHSMLEQSDSLWGGVFQANCLNFDKLLCELFGPEVSLQNELSFSLQFAKPGLEQLKELIQHDIPPSIQALNREMMDAKTPEQREDIEYQFSVIYSIVSSSKSKAHVQFANPESAEGKEIANVLVKHKAGDDLYPYKASIVAKMVGKKTGKSFPVTSHTKAWKKHKIRPEGNAPDPTKTNGTYCMYHKAHGDYTYSKAWVDRLIIEIG